MRRLSVALAVLALTAVCVPAFAGDPGDGMPDFYYFDMDAAMPAGAIYAGEVFAAGTFVIDPDGPSFGLATMKIEAPPAIGFDEVPDPGKNASARHENAGSILTQNGWNNGTERYNDVLLAMEIFDFGAGRDWAIAFLEGTMQIGMTSGPGLMTKEKDGEPFEMKEILTEGLVFEGGLGDQFGSVEYADSGGNVSFTPVTVVVPEPSTIAMLFACGIMGLVAIIRRRR